MRQFLAQGLQQLALLNLGQGQRVIAANTLGCFLLYRYEGFRQALIRMLPGDLAQPIVQFRPATIEIVPIMGAS